MKIVISPAKSLDFKSKLPTSRGTQPQFLEFAIKINRKMERQTKEKLRELMDISSKLADLNYDRYKTFEVEHTKENSRPAIFAFNGDVYIGLDAYSIPMEKLERLQDSLRILSGMYGILKPLDFIQPYRLEMGTSIGIDRKADLYGVWKKKITNSLNNELRKDELFINLASKEYFKAIDKKRLKVPVITPVFKDLKNGKLKIISFFAKKARGAMVRYIIDKDVDSLEGLKGFDYDGYRYSENDSPKENELIFVR
jgi:hypothetical protein